MVRALHHGSATISQAKQAGGEEKHRDVDRIGPVAAAWYRPSEARHCGNKQAVQAEVKRIGADM